MSFRVRIDGRVVRLWSGPAPVVCDFCGVELGFDFVECKTRRGPWASLCIACAGDESVSAGPPFCRVFSLTADGWVSLE